MDQDLWYKYLSLTEDFSLEDLDVEAADFTSNGTIADFRSRAWLVIVDCEHGVNSDSERIRNAEVGLKSLFAEFFAIVAGSSISYEVQISILVNGLIGLWDDLTPEQKSSVSAICRQMPPLRNSLTEDQWESVQERLRCETPEDAEKAGEFFNKMKRVFDHLLWEAWVDGGKQSIPTNPHPQDL